MQLLSTSNTDCRKSSDILSGIYLLTCLSSFPRSKQRFGEINTAKTRTFYSTPDCHRDTFMTTLCLSIKRFSETTSHISKLSISMRPRPEAVKSRGCDYRLEISTHSSSAQCPKAVTAHAAREPSNPKIFSVDPPSQPHSWHGR